MDAIIIKNLAVAYRVGVPEEERSQPQRLELTIEMHLDSSEAARGDDLSHTIDYYAVTQRLLGLGSERSWKLIETLAADIASLLLSEFGAKAVTVEVRKFIIAEAAYVAVRINRP